MPVTVVLDKARYQRCKRVQELARLLPLKFQTFKDVPLVPEPQPLPTALQLHAEKPLSMAA
jgi:hypothetical protein